MKTYILILVASVVFLYNVGPIHAESLFKVKRKDQVTQDWEIHVDYPLFDQLESKELQVKVNESITNKLDHQLDMVQRSANETSGAPILYYEETDVYKEDNFYSVVMTSHFTKGNQYDSSVTSINFENRQGEDLLPLDELVYMDKLNKEVRRKMAEDPEMYLTESFNEVRKDMAYYIEDDRLVLVFNKYEIAAGVHGTPQLHIALKDIEKEREEENSAPLPRVI